jgi:hypothetical protein
MAALEQIDGKRLPLQVPTNLDKMTKAELQAHIVLMAEDFRMLNDIHNQRANDHGWCGEYEERQERYNARLKVLKLVARPGLGRGIGPEVHSGMPGQGL